MFSSRSFMVSGFTFRSLIHFEFSFVYGVRKCSSFILLQVVDQFSLHHLLKRFVFSPLYILASFVEDKVSIGAWIYLWAFYFVPLIYFSVFVPIQPLWRTVWRFLKKLEIELPYDPAIPLLGIHTEETRIERDTCTPCSLPHCL